MNLNDYTLIYRAGGLLAYVAGYSPYWSCEVSQSTLTKPSLNLLFCYTQRALEL
jgi:hypothetical protein